jgi:hypothetical protein
MHLVQQWTTAHEIEHVRNLGAGRLPSDRLKLLLGYLKAAEQRVRWGIIDRGRAVAAAHDEVNNIRLGLG